MEQDELHSLLNPLLPPGWQIIQATHLSELWAGYGHIFRIHIKHDCTSQHSDRSFIVKTIRPSYPSSSSSSFSSSSSSSSCFSKGGEYDEGHARKMLSYQVEANFYRDFAHTLWSSSSLCHMPQLFAYSPAESGRGQTLILEDLAIRYPILAEKRATLSEGQVKTALEWLATFHAHSCNIESASPLPTSSFCPPPSEAVKGWKGRGLWQQGGYSYLSTRLSELESISPLNSPWGRLGLHSASTLPVAIDWCLRNPPNRTHLSLVHGDVKAANMAFSHDAAKLAMYDFQYVGVGLGVQDLAKFLTTSIPARLLNSREQEEKLLKTYHDFLRNSLPEEAEYDWEDLMRDWELALVAWLTFLAGWSRGFWGNVEWLTQRVEQLLSDQVWVENVRSRWVSAMQAQK
ncbi:hypothetical protein NDA13_005211 [Ustilago tritici]|nr:hypothetical protein NDA13_005211 [Ustilago tritici]